VLVGVGQAELRVLEAEPPLLANDVDLKDLLRDGLVERLTVPGGELGLRHGLGRDVVGVPDRAERRDGDEDEGADGRRDQADFDERVAVPFLDDRGGGVAGAGAEADDGVDQEAADEHEQDDDQPDRVHENIILHPRHRTLRIEGRLANRQVGLRAAGGD